MWARFLTTIAATGISMAALSLTPSHLRCEYLINPMGIDEKVPRLSWTLESAERNVKQASYRILVASAKDKLKAGSADLWDSGLVRSDETLNVEYAGRPLSPGQRAWWTVEVADASGRVARPKAAAYWEEGLTEWAAQWIGRANVDKKRIDPSGARWIWYPEGEPAKEAPAGLRTFRKTLDLALRPKRAHFAIAADDAFTLYVNGVQIGKGRGWHSYTDLDATSAMQTGGNQISVVAENGAGRAGLLVLGDIDGLIIHSGQDWTASGESLPDRPALELADANGAPFGPARSLYGAEPAPILKKEWFSSKPVVRARLYASAKGLYRLTLDGKRIGEGIFTPGWTDYRKRIQYQTYDVGAALRPGSHELRMTLADGWYCGNVGWSGREQYGPKPMGLCQLEIEYADGTRERIATDSTWLVGSGPILQHDLLMGETYDARVKEAGWSAPDVQPHGEELLVGQHSPTVRKLAELKPKTVAEPKPGTYVFDLGQNMVGWARLRVEGPAGTAVTLRFAEMLNPDGTIYTTNLRGAKCTDQYTLSGEGSEVYEPNFTFHGFRYVEVTGFPGKPTKASVTGIVLGSATPQTGTFECSDPMVNQLWHNIFWGQRGNYLEVPTDCPQRDERLGWMGDAQIFARTATYNNDIAAFMTKWVQDVRDGQSPEGGYSDVSPRIVDNSDGAPAWGDAGVIVPWTMYVAYGDRRLLERHYDSMKAWVDYIDSANPDHIWIKRSNNNFGDWLNVDADMPRDVLATAYFARSTDLFRRAAAVLGRAEDAQRYGALLADIKKAFNERFVAVDGTIKGDTQTCYVLALWFDLLPAEKRANAIARLTKDIMVARKGHLSTGFVGVGYLCPTLTSVDANDVAYTLLTQKTYPGWGYSIGHGATTIWERWDGWTEDKGFQDPGMNSFNHYSLGSVGEWMYSTVAGIDLDPERPAFKHVVIRPVPGGGLNWAKAAYDSVHGRIETSWKLSGESFELTVTIPANVTATVYVPTKDEAGVRLDGRPAGAVIDLGSGRYVITARKK